MVQGQCICDHGYFGADCSSKVNGLGFPHTFYEGIRGNRWIYYSLPSDQTFNLQIEASRQVSVYLRKGLTNLPDKINFDTVIKFERKVNLNSETVDMSQGAIFAVYCTGDASELTNFSLNYNTTMISLIQFSASPSAAP